MPPIRWKSALLGAVFAVVTYYALVIGILIPSAEMLADADTGVLTVVVIGLQVGLLVLAGWLAAATLRRTHGLERRTDLLPTVLAAGTLGWAVVSTLTVLASVATQTPIPWDALAWTFPLWVATPLAAVGLVGPGPATRRENRYLDRLDREAGAVGAEYAGAIVVVVLLIGSLLVGFGAGGPVSEQVKYVICQALTFGQGGCQAPGTSSSAEAVDPHAPTEPCVQVSTANRHEVALSVVLLAGESGGTITVQEMSDETWRVTQELNGAVGATVGVGGGVSVTVDDTTHGFEAGAGVTGLVDVAGGQTWVGQDEAERDRLVEHLQGERDMHFARTFGGELGPLIEGGMRLWDGWTGDGYTPPPPNESFVQFGAAGEAGAGFAAAGFTRSASVNESRAMGYSTNHDDGSGTIYFVQEVGIAGDGAYDVGLGRAEAGASESTEVLLALTVDGQGTPIHLEAQAQAVGEWNAQVTTLFTGDEPHGPAGSSGHVYAASMDLTTDEAARIAANMLYASGALPGPENPLAQRDRAQHAIEMFTDAARRTGVVTRQDLTGTTTTPFAIQASGEIGVSLGAGFENSTTTITSEGAEYLSDGLWKEWTACT